VTYRVVRFSRFLQQRSVFVRVLSMDNSVVLVVQSPAVDVVTVVCGFEDLYRFEYPGLVAVATAMTGDVGDGEDLVQDTMVKTFIHWGRVGRLQRPGAWCHRVLINACRTRLRRRRIERRFVARARRDERASTGPSADVIAFWQVVRTMPSRPRMAVALYFAGDLTTAEIATILGCPEGTVRSDLSRARVLLARQLGS
jgi:RNA polymerase sigma-70 factor (ECF subfamily)